MKTYAYIVSTIIYLLASFGFILPLLFSSKTDELPILGLIYSVSVPVFIFYLIKLIYKQTKTKTK